MPRISERQPNPGSHRVHRKRRGEQFREMIGDPERFGSWTPMQARGRPREDGEKPITLPALKFLGDKP